MTEIKSIKDYTRFILEQVNESFDYSDESIDDFMFRFGFKHDQEVEI